MKKAIFFLSALLTSVSYLFSQSTATLSFPNLTNEEIGAVSIPITIEDISDKVLGVQYYCLYDIEHLNFTGVSFPHENFPAGEWNNSFNNLYVNLNWFDPAFCCGQIILPGEVIAVIEFDWDGECTELIWGISESETTKGLTEMYDPVFNTYELTLINGSICDPVGIQDHNLNAISIYPNPAGDLITIEGNDEFFSIEIFNIAGALIKSEFSNTKLHIMNVESLNKGVYIFRIIGNNNLINQKITIY